MTSSSRPWIGAVGFAALWGVLAAASPTTTFHLGPAIVAALPGAAARRRADSYRLGAIGFAIAAATALGLSLAGWLRGPSLLPDGGPLIESLLGAGLGAVAGAILTRSPAIAKARSAPRL